MSDIKPLFFNHSHHLLQVHGCNSSLDVLCFEGEENLSEPFRYTIEFTSSDRAITPQQMLLQNTSLTLQAPVDQGFGIKIQQPVRVLQGTITTFERISTSKEETRYALTLQPRLALLSKSHQNRIYQDMSVPQIVEHILRTRHHMRGEDFVFRLAHEYPRREQVMQYGEDDLTFISRLLGEVGIWFRFTADTRLNIDVAEFFDDQQHYEAGLMLPSVAPSGQHDGGSESVWDLQSRHHVVERSVFTRDYNYRNAPEDMNLNINVSRGDSTTYGEAYHWADNYLAPGNRYQHTPDPESGAFYARIRHERYLNQQTRLSGETNCATLAPGQLLKVNGGEEVTEVWRRGVAITAIHCRARRDRSFEVTFQAIPSVETYCFRPAIISKPKMAGTLPARVTSTKINDLYGHIDRDGRYRVNLLFDRDRWQPGEESLWVRQARPYAGETFGLHLPLLAGTEVAIAFEQGDPDRPYIAGALHDSTHQDHVTLYNYKRNVLRTPANNKIRLDDTRGKEHVKVSTEYGGKSQLNLGHLVDHQNTPRGEGFELRTDSYGAIRAGKGIFITADEQLKAMGAVAEMEPASKLLSAAAVQLNDWQEIARTHYNIPPDISTLKQFVGKAVNLASPVLLMSAPKGIGIVTAETTLLQSGKGLYLQSASDIALASGNRLSVNTKNAISLLSHREGMRMVSVKGPLEIESHGDTLALTSLKDITVQSTQGHLQLTAKNGITLGCGGGYIRLTPQGEIHLHSPSLLSFKGTHKMQGPAGETFPLPDLPTSICKDCLIHAQELAQTFVPRAA
ncbi:MULTISPECIES: type VI secretion system Vgr family protein [Klebsiella]|uniref:type VI secretion system Vgr family protein n=1 Tax=Klebsiella TaxID=570 RepID=UPI00063CB64A|nr:type VI secretion system Vgr family protein [Klebsiella aerogenes]EIW9476507.1 type VI secretion system tip protein VgrG [Klebsiella aerogenes]EIW9496710.1 type VI secretion system tip protein VgrG [Klebsiella aerogenes]EKM7512053.1 type VI secretion system tip protein VgrG [Klebsiella aerogenes]EKV8808625.1 type VI secretion system tip protein VgrG [Klebsiella aerogenes]ELJ2005650.1 type VI secretion system tip protein VgrG [Klebsiella aerogenes]